MQCNETLKLDVISINDNLNNKKKKNNSKNIQSHSCIGISE